MKSFFIAIAMYSKLPAPMVEWDKKSLSWALCFFPVVGVVIGLLMAAGWALSAVLGFSPLLRGFVMLILPVLVSGGIHLDGFCDTCDALSSHQPRERKLEILKDSHTGAFAIICCCLYLMALLVFWREAEPAPGVIGIAALMPVLSRAMSGFFAASLPNARGSGLLASFTQPMDGEKARVILLLWVFAAALGMGLSDLWLALWVLAGAFLSALYYVTMSRRQFGGITGDLAGFFLQVAECAMVLFLVLGQKVGGLLWC